MSAHETHTHREVAMPIPSVVGLLAVKVPVSDLERSRAWYRDVFGMQVVMEFPDEHGVIRGVGCSIPALGNTSIALRELPAAASAMSGYDPLTWAIESADELDRWAEHLDSLSITHSGVVHVAMGWRLIVADPDDIEHHLFSRNGRSA